MYQKIGRFYSDLFCAGSKGGGCRQNTGDGRGEWHPLPKPQGTGLCLWAEKGDGLSGSGCPLPESKKHAGGCARRRTDSHRNFYHRDPSGVSGSLQRRRANRIFSEEPDQVWGIT